MKRKKRSKKTASYPLSIARFAIAASFGVIVSQPLAASPNSAETLKDTAIQEQANEETEGIEWIVDLDIGQERAKEENKPLLAYFYSEHCFWCKKLDAEVFSNARIIELSKQMVFVRIDADKNAKLSTRHSIKYLPTMLFFSPDGEVEDVAVGYQDKFKMLGLLYEALS